MALQDFVDYTTPTIGASWLNIVDTRHVSVKQYGAVLDGTTSDATAIASAVAATTGTLLMQNGAYTTATLPASYPLVTFDYLGTALANVYQESGETTRYARRLIRGQQAGSHNGAEYSLKSLEYRPVGSGTNGPTHADYGLTVSVIKQGFPSSVVAGEIDGINVVTRNCGAAGAYNADTAAYLYNTGTVGSFAAGIEGVTSSFNSSGVVQKQMNCQMGIVDIFGASEVGFYAKMTTGTGNVAFQANSEATCAWSNFLYFANSAGLMRFQVDGNGQMLVGDFAGGASVRRIRNSGGSLAVVNNANTVEVFTISDGGEIAATGNIKAGATGAYFVNAIQVVGARDTGWTAMTGTANEATVYDTATVTLAQLAGRVMALQAALTTHGLIGA